MVKKSLKGEMEKALSEGEMPTGKMGKEGEMPTGKMGKEGEMPTGKMGKESEMPIGKIGKEGEMPTGNMGEEGKMPTGNMGEEVEMPTGYMGEMGEEGEMPTGNMGEEGEMPAGMMQKETEVLVEMRIPGALSAAAALQMVSEIEVHTFQLDTNYTPVSVSSKPEDKEQLEAANEEVVIVRGTIEESKIPELESQPNVIKVWKDTRIAPFIKDTPYEQPLVKAISPASGTCPIPPCDCSPGTPKGTIADVAHYLGADQIWATGIKGDGIVVGIVDGGITALGRTPKPGETAKIPRVIGGWPTADWGATSIAWGDHGNMTSTDVLGMAPNAQIYDIRISNGDAISNALAGFDWAINQHKANGTPQILSNSWGIFQKSWDSEYACNPNHPFTRKVLEAINEGIIVLFAAGNCGDTCPDGRCGSDVGSGKSIWGANGHPRVITVGAVNINEQFVGYSSIGPACLDPNKPDFCSITHFKGYFNSDSGTSAATPIASGVVALLKQARPSITQDEVKSVLKITAKDIGSPGWDKYTGAGIIRAKAAFDQVVQTLGRLEVFARGSDHALWHMWQTAPSNGWSGWASLGGWIDSPVVARNADGRLEVFVIGSDNALWHMWQTAPNNGWSSWASLGGWIDQLTVGQNKG